MIENFRNKRILLIVAHPDDEILGIGATMNMLISAYNSVVHVLILGEGITSRTEQRDMKKSKHDLAIHQGNVIDAQTIIGYQSIRIGDLPDNRFDTVALLDIVKIIEEEKNNFQPDIIFTHHSEDLNIDHRITYKAVITATRPMQGETVKTIISFETPSATEWQFSSNVKPFSPNLFFQVNKWNLEIKIKAMESYLFERRDYPHPRSPEALEIRAKYWGVVVGCSYAEACVLIRSIN